MSTSSEPQPVIALSWIVELPHDLGLPNDSRTDLVRPGGFCGWNGEDLGRLPRWDVATLEGHPVLALRFRRARVGIGTPTEATDRCFGDMQASALSARGRKQYERDLKRVVARGMRAWKTVVRITQWYPASAIPAEPELDAWLLAEFRRGLSVLNEWLSTYALASASLSHGPLSLVDLPAAVPTIMEGKDQPDDDVVYGHRMLALHDRTPAPQLQGDVDAAEQAARSLLMDSGDSPFLEPLQVLYEAQVHLASGRERHAVLDSGTGTEMLISALLRAVAEARTTFDARAALRNPFRDRFERHLPLALGDGNSPAEDLNTARASWWSQGYLLRNRVVHEGQKAEPDPASAAVAAAWNLVEACGELLRRSPDTASLGDLLRVVWHTNG